MTLLPFVRFLYEPDIKTAGEPHWLEVLKTTLALLGHPVGPPRPPLRVLSAAPKRRLERILRDLGELPSPSTGLV